MGSLYTLNFKFDDNQAKPCRPPSTTSLRAQGKPESYCAIRNDIENTIMFCKIANTETPLNVNATVNNACEAGNHRSPIGTIIVEERNVQVQLSRPEHLQQFVASFRTRFETLGFSAYPTQRVCISQRRPLSTLMVSDVILLKILNSNDICVLRASEPLRTSATEDAVQQYSTSDLTWQNVA